MDRARIPSCTRCKLSYQISDTNRYKVPMLLNCGHDMCKQCIKSMYKKNREVICEVCKTDCKMESESDINNIPLHYYLIGKVWYLMANKPKEMYRNLSNLQLRNLTSDFVQKNNICDSCHRRSVYFCIQCNEMFCENCFPEHIANPNFSYHEVQITHSANNEFIEENICDQHLRPIDIICVTCQLDMCSICAIEDHRPHDIQPLEKYNLNSINILNEYSKKGENLLKKLKLRRDGFKSEILKYQDPKNELDVEKRNVTMFVYSAIGTLQCIEQNMLKLLNEAEISIFNSINKVTDQMSNAINNLQHKLNSLDILLKNKHNSSALLSEVINDIGREVNTTFYIIKKNKTKQTKIFLNYDIFMESIKKCIVPKIDKDDIYLLEHSPELPPNYSLYFKIDNALSSSLTASEIRPSSSLSSRSSQSSIPTDQSLNYKRFEQKLSPVNNYASYVKEITITEVESITVIHLNSPSDFYVQLNANISIMKLVDTKLNEFVHNKQSIVNCIEKNNIMYAVQMASNQWCRGNVIHIFEEGNQNMYTVFFIDYGFTETVTADRIRNVSASITLIPPLAYNCALYNLKPSLTTGWSNDAYSMFSELMLEKTGSFYLYPINLDIERIEVEIVWKINDYKLPIRHAMFFMGYGGQFAQYANDTLHKQLVNILTLPKREKLEIKERYNVVLSHLISPSEFYFRIDDDLNAHLLREAMELLEAKYRSTEINTHKSYLLYTPQIGMAVAARYSIDSNWYRAKIISLPEPRMVTVFYIDYGNSETLLWDQLRVLDKELIKTPPLAVKASLADVYPAVDGIECASWNDLACAAFIELTENHHNIDTHLTALIHDIDKDTYNVILYNHTSRGEFCVNQKLLSRGYGANRNPMSIAFQKPNVRKPTNNQKPLPINCRINEIKFSTDSDATVFIKPRSVTIQNHIFPKMEGENNDVPGIKMSVFKVVSPYDITLKYADYNLSQLTELMNKVYTEHKIKKIPKVELKKNNLCAVFIQKYGNWYRGRIVTVQQNKKTTSIYFYDLDETLDQISTNALYVLENRFVQAKCGLVRCCMDRLIPLGISDGSWPQFSCDRLIEELQKHNIIYFVKTGKKDSNTVLGEIWVREVVQPKALEPLWDKWMNINKFMVEQGFAITEKQNLKDNVNLNAELSLPIETPDLFYLKPAQCWLPPTPLTQSQFKAYVMYVDMECNLYLQLDDCEISQLLKSIEEELNEIFAESKPEPQNYKWAEKQMVIVKYHLDNKWYRGTIIQKNENDQYKVQFLDYGNIETCSHEQLRSTVYMTDIPQLCVKGFFSIISPCSEKNDWNTVILDHIHGVLVEKLCTVTVDLKLSFNNLYAITFIKTEQCPDICQYLVKHNMACYSFAKGFTDPFDFGDTTDEDEMCTANKNNLINTDKDGMHTANNKNEINTDEDGRHSANNNDEMNNDKMKLLNITDDEINVTDDDRTMTNKDQLNITVNDKRKTTCFSRFCLKVLDEVIEGTVCDIVGPTRMRFLAYKVNGIDIINKRDKMHREMFDRCVDLPVLEKFEPGDAVIVLHNVFWRRGVIGDDCKSVTLVDMGVSVKLVKNNLRPCPSMYFKLPMFSIECQLANLAINEHTDGKTVAKELSKLLRGVNLKITGVDNLDADVVDVMLFDETGQLAYQSLIDSKMLIPK